MKSKETVKISSNKQIVEHLYPDGSVVADSKETKLKHINNKQGVEATFDLEGNKFLDKDVKKHFRYGSDVIYIMQDDTVIIKKKNGESVIMKPDNTIEQIDKFGEVKFKQDDHKHLHYILNNKADKNLYTDV